MESFVESRSRNSVIKRMIELGLIAERSEILPSKRKKSSNKSRQPSSNMSDGETSDSDSNSDSDGSDKRDTRKVRVTVKTTKNSKKSKKAQQNKAAATRHRLNAIQMNVADVQRQINDIDESVKEHFAWLQESLNDAAEDAAADDDDDPNDGVPLVPYSSAQKEALENPQFKSILLGLGLQEPVAEMVCALNLLSLDCASLFTWW